MSVSPNLSLNESSVAFADFEYDYSEFAVPGSILHPAFGNFADDQANFVTMVSEICIDEILGESSLLAARNSNNSDQDHGTNKSCGENLGNCSNAEMFSVATQIRELDEEIDRRKERFVETNATQFHYL